MHCRNCGEAVNEKAVSCPHCGLPPLAERNFCQECGNATKPKQVVCVECGVALKSKTIASGKAKGGWYCSSDEKIIFGLCGGLAHRFKMDPMVVRVLMVLGSIASGGTIGAAYIIMGAIMAKDGIPTKEVEE